MLRIALRGRWLALLVLVLTAAAVCVRLGIWQLDRRDERLAFNARVEERGEAPAVALGDLVSPAAGPAGVDAAEYRPVVVSGHFDPTHEILVRARSLNGTPGQHVLTPLVVEPGVAVLVNRGFVPVTDPDAALPEDARAPDGEVEVAGVFRAGEQGGRFDPAEPAVAASGTLGHVTRVDVDRLAAELPYDLFPGYVRVEAERPEPRVVPVALPPLELGEGPHLGYAFQWFGFATVFVVGYPVLVRRVAKGEGPAAGRPGEPARSSPESDAPALVSHS